MWSVCTIESHHVLKSRMWHIANRPLISRKWNPSMQLLKFQLTKISIWIKHFTYFNTYLTPKRLSEIASGAGISLYLYTIAQQGTRMNFAQSCVEVDINDECRWELRRSYC